MFLTEVGNKRQWSSFQVGKMPIFKSQVGKVFFKQTTNGQSVISPFNLYIYIITKSQNV